MDEQLREAIKFIKAKREEVQADFGYSDKDLQACDTLLNFAQSYLALSGKVPGEKEEIYPEDFKCGGCGVCPACEHYDKIEKEKYTRNNGYNLGRQETLLAITGLLGEEKIKEICIRELWHPDLFDDLKIDPLDMNARQALKATAKIIASAIRSGVINGEGK